MKVRLTIGAILLSCCFSNAFAVNVWYWGNVTKIQTYGSDGSFMIYLDNPNIQSICSNKRVFFSVSNMGAERTKAALSMALTAFTAGKKWGVVVDLPTTPANCHAATTSSQGAGIQ